MKASSNDVIGAKLELDVDLLDRRDADDQHNIALLTSGFAQHDLLKVAAGREVLSNESPRAVFGEVVGGLSWIAKGAWLPLRWGLCRKVCLPRATRLAALDERLPEGLCGCYASTLAKLRQRPWDQLIPFWLSVQAVLTRVHCNSGIFRLRSS